MDANNGPRPPARTGAHAAEADLEIGELQDLADAIGEVAKAAAGYPLTIHVRIAVGGTPPQATVNAVGALLEDVSSDLSMD